MKRINLAAIALVCIIIFAGCSAKPEEYEKNTLIIGKKGTLTEVAVEDFTGSPVKADEVKSYVEDQVSSYNEGKDHAIEVKSINTEDMSKVKLVLTYKDIAGYNAFNELNCVLDAYSNVDPNALNGTFSSPAGGSFNLSDIADPDNAKVLQIDEAKDIVIQGTILCWNDEVSVKDDIATTSGNGTAIIIFK